MNSMRTLISVTICFFAMSLSAQEASVTPLFQTDLDGIEGREGLMVIVDFPPGDSSAAHRHNAHTFVFVLEGSVVMQVEGEERVVLSPGQIFYETPEDIHVVSMNASTTEPAKILVFFVKRQGAPVTVPAG